MADVLVGLIMGSKSDWDTMQHAAQILDALGIAHETKIVSAHRTPEALREWVESLPDRGVRVVICGAGGAARSGDRAGSAGRKLAGREGDRGRDAAEGETPSREPRSPGAFRVDS